MKAFSLIELLFVIVIMGILMFAGLQFIPDDTLRMDTQMLKQKILQKKSNALGYRSVGEDPYVCITLDKDSLNEEDRDSNETVHYTFKSDIEVSGIDGNVICFDYTGRVYNGNIDTNLSNILHTKVVISLKYRNKQSSITIYPISGSVR